MRVILSVLLIIALILFTIIICIANAYKEEVWSKIEFEKEGKLYGKSNHYIK